MHPKSTMQKPTWAFEGKNPIFSFSPPTAAGGCVPDSSPTSRKLRAWVPAPVPMHRFLQSTFFVSPKFPEHLRRAKPSERESYRWRADGRMDGQTDQPQIESENHQLPTTTPPQPSDNKGTIFCPHRTKLEAEVRYKWYLSPTGLGVDGWGAGEGSLTPPPLPSIFMKQSTPHSERLAKVWSTTHSHVEGRVYNARQTVLSKCRHSQRKASISLEANSLTMWSSKYGTLPPLSA